MVRRRVLTLIRPTSKGVFFKRFKNIRGLVSSAVPQVIAMALNLAPSQHDLIKDMILDKKLKTNKMADVAECSERSIKAIRSNIHYYGTTKAPPNGGRRPRSITPL
jgi:hypothetical protein